MTSSSKNHVSALFHLSRTHVLITILLSLFLFFFLSSPSSLQSQSPSLAFTTLTSRLLLFPNSNDEETGAAASSSSSSLGMKGDNGVRKAGKSLISSCDIFSGKWVVDDKGPVYSPGSCPFIDDTFNCYKNGRPDMGYFKYKWKPHGCFIPRFDGKKMLKMLRGKRVVFVGDSLNRNMWQSLVCALWESSKNKRRVFEASGKRELRTQGYYSIRFQDYKCSIDFIKSPFLVQELRTFEMSGKQRETLKLDRMQRFPSKYQDADILIFNTGHWWTHQKAYKSKNYFQEGNRIYDRLEVAKAYKRALNTWARWVDANINDNRTKVFFRGYSASHFRGGQWNSGGSCDNETQPETDESYQTQHPWMMTILKSVIGKMKTPVVFLNITSLTGPRKDGHPSIYRRQEIRSRGGMFQDCSHWCLPGVPDSWNELLFSTLLGSNYA